jgi:hypothetical protein
VRLSVSIEHIDDIIADIEALRQPEKSQQRHEFQISDVASWARSRNLLEQLAPRHQIAKASRSVFVGSLVRGVAAMRLRFFMSESSSPDHFSCRCASAATGVCQHPRR